MSILFKRGADQHTAFKQGEKEQKFFLTAVK
jgi:hypothetical protein